MRATAKVTVTMGQVIIKNCRLFKAIEEAEKVKLNNLHVTCLNRINEIVRCVNCNKDIADKKIELIKGYPTKDKDGKEKWVTLTQEEIDSCKQEATDLVRIIQFVDPTELCPIYFSSSYFLTAEKDGSAPFSLLYLALKQSNLIALAKMISRGKDHFLAMTAYEGIIIAYDLHFPAEIRNTSELDQALPPDTFDQETIDLIMNLIKKMQKPFDPTIIIDEYNDSLRALIETKAKGQKPSSPSERKEDRKVISLKDALKGSLAA